MFSWIDWEMWWNMAWHDWCRATGLGWAPAGVRCVKGWGGGGKGIEGRGLTGTMMTIYITPVRSSRKPQKGTAVLPGGRQKRCPVQWQRRCERGIGTALSHARFCTRIPKNKFENSQIDYGSIVGVALLAGACEYWNCWRAACWPCWVASIRRPRWFKQYSM
jgi:hypothetical protein